jgi:ABC-type transport system substrate-binding protein
MALGARDNYWKRRQSRRTFLAGGTTAAIGTAAILAGCGDDDDTGGQTPSAGRTPTTGQTPGQTPQVQGIRGGTLRSSTLDPHRGSDPMINSLEPVLHTPKVYSWTHRYHVRENKFILDMATSIEQTDPTTVTVKIRPDIKFHNVDPMNGRVVTSEDLAYTYKRFPVMRTRGSNINPQAYNWMDLEALQTPDKQTLVIKQSKVFAENLIMMAQHFYGVIAREADEKAGGDLSKTNTAGSGPYILTQSDPSVKVVWTRNPDYFSHDHSDQFWFPPGGGYPDAYEQRVIPDPSTTQAQLISGDLDQLYFNVLNVDRLLAQDLKSKGLNVDEGQANTNCTLVMAAPNFPDVRARQAIQKAIDYQNFINTVYVGDGELGAPVGNGFTDAVRLPRSEIAKYLKTDVAEAKRLWEATGLGNKRFVMLGIANFPFMEQATSNVKQALERNLGVTVEIQAIDIPSWIARAVAAEKDWDFLVQFSQSVPDVPTFNILGTFDPNGTANNGSLFKVDSPVPQIAEVARRANELSNAHYTETNPEARTAKLHAFQRYVLEQAVPGIPLPVRKIDWLVTNKRVKNVPVSNPNFFRSNLVDNMWLDPNRP